MYQNEEEHAAYIGELIAKEIQGLLTDPEHTILQQWVSESLENQDTYKRCHDSQTQLDSHLRLGDIDIAKAYKRIKVRMQARSVKTRFTHFGRITRYASIAVGLLVLGASLYLFYLRHSSDLEQKVAVDYEAASYRASVVLSDGRTFSLNDKDTLIIDNKGLRDRQGNILSDLRKVTFAKISTPRGGIYDVTLPDGTLVKLNAASTLEYPTTWEKNQRKVVLEGEAYFEVAPRVDQPFIVYTNKQKIAVLGTHFNVFAYPDNMLTKTTLLEGKVRVESLQLDQKINLQPGEQSILSQYTIQKRNVDVQQEVAWLHSKFNFDGKTLREVMDELSRWYDIDVSYEGDIPQVEFFGGTFRTGKISAILDILKTYGIDYRMTADRHLIISKYKSSDKKGGAKTND